MSLAARPEQVGVAARARGHLSSYVHSFSLSLSLSLSPFRLALSLSLDLSPFSLVLCESPVNHTRPCSCVIDHPPLLLSLHALSGSWADGISL